MLNKVDAKRQVDTVWHYPVAAAAEIDWDGSSPIAGETFGGLTMADGTRILLTRNVNVGNEMFAGIYEVFNFIAATSFEIRRLPDSDSGSPFRHGETVYVQGGTAAQTVFVQTEPDGVVNTNIQIWSGAVITGGIPYHDELPGSTPIANEFDLTHAPMTEQALEVYVNGVLIPPSLITLAAATVTIDASILLEPDDVIVAVYVY